ncbi:MAG: hypothetical protein HUK26_02815 [Duodenibacillus sp.]|nr:hypothetical protein [Oscillospiraceae bacterium]MCF0253251.1 hypothetical protein [Duodenibacillus sp.]
MSAAKAILASAFIALISVPFVGRYIYCGNAPDTYLQTENRLVTPYKKLKLRKDKIKPYFKNLDLYISDRLIFKDKVVSTINAFVLRSKNFLNLDYSKGFFGADDFLFLGNDQANVIDKHFKKDYKVNINSLGHVSEKHHRLSQVTASVGGEYFVFIAPDKHSIYCEKIPSWVRINVCSDTAIVTKTVSSSLKNQGIKVIFPYEELRKGMGKHLYYKGDTHWNKLGAELGFKILMQDIVNNGNIFKSQPFKSNLEYTINEQHIARTGDLVAIMGLPADFKTEETEFTVSSSAVADWSEKGGNFEKKKLTEIRTRGYMKNWFGQTKNNSATNDMKVLIICDSFMTAMAEYFNMNFSNVYFMSQQHTLEEMERSIQNFKPNLVVFETVERSLIP